MSNFSIFPKELSLMQRDNSLKVTRRLVVVQGPTNLLTALTAIAYETEKKTDKFFEDILLLSGFYTTLKASIELKNICLKMATVWNFKKIIFLQHIDIMFHNGKIDFLQYAAYVSKALGNDAIHEVYVSRNMQIVNEVVLNLYNSSRKICYGDHFGVIDLNCDTWVKPSVASGYVQIDDIITIMPIENIQGAFCGRNIDVIPICFFQKVTLAISLTIIDIADICKKISMTSIESITIFCLSNLTEKKTVRCVADEINLYKEHLYKHANKKHSVVIKGHPRENNKQTYILAEELRKNGYSVDIFHGCNLIPLELFAYFLNVDKIVAFISGPAAGWRSLNPAATLVLGAEDALIAKYADMDFLDHVARYRQITKDRYTLACMATTMSFRPVRRTSRYLGTTLPMPLEIPGRPDLWEKHWRMFFQQEGPAGVGMLRALVERSTFATNWSDILSAVQPQDF